MGLFDKLFGKRQAKENTQSASQTYGGTVSQGPMSDQWVQFFSVVEMEKTSADALHAFVGKWPDGIDPAMFASIDLPALLPRISDYRKMKYPLRSPYFGSADLPCPTYKIVDGKIGRASTMIDMIFVEVVPPNIKKMFKPND
jgi:hypothetical protein